MYLSLAQVPKCLLMSFSFRHISRTPANSPVPTTTTAAVKGPQGDLFNQKCNDVRINMTTDGEYYSFKVRRGGREGGLGWDVEEIQEGKEMEKCKNRKCEEGVLEWDIKRWGMC